MAPAWGRLQACLALTIGAAKRDVAPLDSTQCFVSSGGRRGAIHRALMVDSANASSLVLSRVNFISQCLCAPWACWLSACGGGGGGAESSLSATPVAATSAAAAASAAQTQTAGASSAVLTGDDALAVPASAATTSTNTASLVTAPVASLVPLAPIPQYTVSPLELVLNGDFSNQLYFWNLADR